MRSQTSIRKLKRRCRHTLLLAVASIAVISVGCNSTPARSKDIEEELQAALDGLRSEYSFPGATAALLLGDGTLVAASTGLADDESDRPMTPATRMLAASIGKTFVSSTVLELAAEDRLSLDSPASLWLANEGWFERLPNHASVTVRHLLNHTSGIPNHVEDSGFAAAFSTNWSEAETLSPEALVGFVLDKPALFPAGEGWSYTDTGYILLGLVIEKVTKRSYYEEVTERFLVPQRLTSTAPSNHRDLTNLATGYVDAANPFGLPTRTTDADGRMHWNPAIEWTGGGLISNSRDLARWGKLLFEGEAMETEYLDELLLAVPVDADNDLVGYGAGVSIHREGESGPWYGHSGWIPGYTSTLRYYPAWRAALAFQINTDIGIVDNSTDLFDQMAARLERILSDHDAD